MGDDKISASKPKIEEAIKKKEKHPNKGPQKKGMSWFERRWNKKEP